ncbi:hypothetical protein MMC19_006728 [Ptychographa xylographoides]|nr:hypothetical protein [Ptychographa xylographoides]
MKALGILLPAILFLIHTTDAARKTGDRVLLSTVQTLTLRKDLKTSHRRVSAVPQLNCIGGNAKGLYEVDILRCKNQGSDYDEENIQWTCTASLPEEFKLGSTDVICEGYESAADPYVLKGSCGVEYRLILTDIGEEKYGKKSKGLFDDYKGKGYVNWPAIFFWGVFIAVVGWMIYAAFFRDRRAGAGTGGNNNNSWGWGGGGGGGGPGGDDAPPPYDYDTKPSSTRSRPAPGQEAWRPGFWTGALGGAAAGYMAGNRPQRDQGTWGNRQSGGSWFNNDNGEGSSGYGGRTRSSGSSSSSFSSTRHQSSGFGSTSRR